MANATQEQNSNVKPFPEFKVPSAPKSAPAFTVYSKEWWIKNQGTPAWRAWTNPTTDVQWFEIAADIPRWIDPSTVPESDRIIRFIFQPGQTMDLPDLDWLSRAIVRVENGVVVGGLAVRMRAAGMNVIADLGLSHLDGEPFAPGGV